MASLTSVKVKHGKTIRRFTADNIETLFPNLNSLRYKIFSLFFLHAETDDFTLKYIDEDGDEVSLLDSEDLSELFRQNLNPLTILVESKTDLRHVLKISDFSSGSHRSDDQALAYFRSLRPKACLGLALELSNALILLIDSVVAELVDGGVSAENVAEVGIDALKEISNCERQGDHDHDDNNIDLNVSLLAEFSTQKLMDGQEKQSKTIEGGDVLGKEDEGFESHSDHVNQDSENVKQDSERFAVKIDSTEADLEDDASLKACKAVNSGSKLEAYRLDPSINSKEALNVLQHAPEPLGNNANDTIFGFKISLPANDMLVSDTESDSGDDNDGDDDDSPVESNDKNELDIVVTDHDADHSHDHHVGSDDDLVDTNGSESADVETFLETNDADGDFPEKSDFGDEEISLAKLSEMGFAENEFTKEVLKVHRYNIEDSIDDLCGDSEWDLMLEELLEMEFTRKWW